MPKKTAGVYALPVGPRACSSLGGDALAFLADYWPNDAWRVVGGDRLRDPHAPSEGWLMDVMASLTLATKDVARLRLVFRSGSYGLLNRELARWQRIARSRKTILSLPSAHQAPGLAHAQGYVTAPGASAYRPSWERSSAWPVGGSP